MYRTRPLSLHQTLVDEIGTLQAVGLQGPIQAMRDFTQAAYAAMQPVVLPTLAMGLLFLGATAWREGSALRKKSSSAALNLRDFQLLALCLVLDFVGYRHPPQAMNGGQARGLVAREHGLAQQ